MSVSRMSQGEPQVRCRSASLALATAIDLEAMLGQHFGDHVAEQELVLDQQDP